MSCSLMKNKINRILNTFSGTDKRKIEAATDDQPIHWDKERIGKLHYA